MVRRTGLMLLPVTMLISIVVVIVAVLILRKMTLRKNAYNENNKT